MPRSSDQRIVDLALARLMAELGTELVGLLASGSRVNGSIDRHSDLDLHALIASPRAQRRAWVIEGIEAVIDLGPRLAVLKMMDRDRASGTGATQHMWSTGIAAYDPRGAVRALKAEAARQWRAGPRAVAHEELWRLRLVPARMLDDVAELLGTDDPHAAHVLTCAVARLEQTHCRLRGRWGTAKAKRAFREMDGWDPVAACLFRRANTGALPERYGAARELMEHCLAPIGGPMPREDWEAPWVPVRDAASASGPTATRAASGAARVID